MYTDGGSAFINFTSNIVYNVKWCVSAASCVRVFALLIIVVNPCSAGIHHNYGTLLLIRSLREFLLRVSLCVERHMCQISRSSQCIPPPSFSPTPLLAGLDNVFVNNVLGESNDLVLCYSVRSVVESYALHFLQRTLTMRAVRAPYCPLKTQASVPSPLWYGVTTQSSHVEYCVSHCCSHCLCHIRAKQSPARPSFSTGTSYTRRAACWKATTSRTTTWCVWGPNLILPACSWPARRVFMPLDAFTFRDLSR